MDDRVVAKELAAVALKTLSRHSLFIEHPESMERLTTQYLKPIALSRQSGAFEVFKRKGAISAFFLMWHETETYYCQPTTFVTLHGDCEDAGAMEWLRGTVRNQLSSAPDDIDLDIDSCYDKLFGAILESGLSINSLKLVGLVEKALAYLNQNAVSLPDGFSFRDATQQDIPRILEIYRQSYQEEHGWFINTPAFLAKTETKLLKKVEKENLHCLVLKEGIPFGYFEAGYWDYKEAPYWGSAGGIEPVLHPSIQKCGLSRSLYKHVLEKLRERDIRVFTGHTSQKPVMYLGKQMGRSCVAVSFRKKRYFDPSYFDDFLKPSLRT